MLINNNAKSTVSFIKQAIYYYFNIKSFFLKKPGRGQIKGYEPIPVMLFNGFISLWWFLIIFETNLTSWPIK